MRNEAHVVRALVPAVVIVAVVAASCTDTLTGNGDEYVDPDPDGRFPTHHETPSWSSGGEIAYRDNGIIWVDPAGFFYDVDPSLAGLWIIDPETDDATRIHAAGWQPDWSPSGDDLAFVIGGQLYRADRGGAGEVQLTWEERNFRPSWSGDGGSIAWHRTSGVEPGLWVMSASGQNHEFLVRHGYFPEWHPLRNAMLYAGWQGSTHGILEYFVNTGTSTLLRADREETSSLLPSYSPDGAHIAFAFSEAGELPQVWIMDADGANARQITQCGGTDPSWSPDGTRIVYARTNNQLNTSEDGVLWIVDVETGEHRQLTHRWDDARRIGSP